MYLTGADALDADLWQALCTFGERVGAEVIFVSAEPARRAAALGGKLAIRSDTHLRVDPERAPVHPAIGVQLPAAAFPALPAACEALLEPAHAVQARAIYDECLVAAYKALRNDRLPERDDADFALRATLARAPDLAAVPLAFHALRAAGILRGHDIRIGGDRLGSGVAIDALLTADRIEQLSAMLDPDLAMAGVLSGMHEGWSRPRVDGDGLYLRLERANHRVSDRLGVIVRAWVENAIELGSPSRRLKPPPRRPDVRWRELWRTPPPDRVYVTCEPIECESLRFIAVPRMDWARPTREEGNAERPRFRPC